VIKSLQDLNCLKQMTTSAYNDIIKSEKYSYKFFIREVEKIIDDYILNPKRLEFISTPVVIRSFDGDVPIEFRDFNISSSIIDRNIKCYGIVKSFVSQCFTI